MLHHRKPRLGPRNVGLRLLLGCQDYWATIGKTAGGISVSLATPRAMALLAPVPTPSLCMGISCAIMHMTGSLHSSLGEFAVHKSLVFRWKNRRCEANKPSM
jgi:hypothetical protein